MKLEKDRLVPVLETLGYNTIGNTDVWKKASEDPEDSIFWGVDFKKNEVFKWVRDHREYDAHADPVLMELRTLAESIEEQSGEPSTDAPESTDQSTKGEQSEEESTNKDKALQAYENNALIDLIHGYVGNDVLEVFGDTGSGKSKFAMAVAKEVIASGKKVFYLDTERNLTETDIAGLKGCEYKYTPIIDEIDSICQKLPKVDVVIVDSIGFPILTSYARLSVKQKGDALLKLIAIFGDLKGWAYKNNGTVLVTNQPESEFNKAPNHILRPFGDKSQFAAKEIWKTEIVDRKPAYTNIRISAFRSRSVGHRTKIADMRISSSGVEVQT
ncbi:ATP-binding protein [Methanolobus halotolerans]|uniref:AAA+ ATPase domain-containing protein n=1 Tax=Methanolobus halotolerans TaxID=2052935 RepID=A0A4E0QU50_9EURY|nr:AAA family ATPase [Methanolobus halotolerans]TGC11575.1 hypothetical protein CUN85_01540 [Methanolobus halotolerans]